MWAEGTGVNLTAEIKVFKGIIFRNFRIRENRNHCGVGLVFYVHHYDSVHWLSAGSLQLFLRAEGKSAALMSSNSEVRTQYGQKCVASGSGQLAAEGWALCQMPHCLGTGGIGDVNYIKSVRPGTDICIVALDEYAVYALFFLRTHSIYFSLSFGEHALLFHKPPADFKGVSRIGHVQNIVDFIAESFWQER